MKKWAGYLEAAGTKVEVLGYSESIAPDTWSYRSLIERHDSGLPSKLLNILSDMGLLRSKRYDAVNFHFLNDRWSFYALVARAPVIITCWGSDILVDFAKAGSLRRRLRIAALSRAAAITGDSEDLLLALTKAVPGAAARIGLVCWGVDQELFRPDGPSGLREELQIPRSTIVVLCNRSCSSHYQIEKIVAAFAARIRDQDICLVVRIQPGADPEYRRRCMQAAEGAANIRFLERRLADDELPELYRGVDAVLHYPLTDATPVSMLEALASGCAVFCDPDIPSYEQLARDYRIQRISLDSLDADVVRRTCPVRPDDAAANRATFLRLHAGERSVAALAATFGAAMNARR
jgi:glycosyltransferase involved in cell wall biosynthesis